MSLVLLYEVRRRRYAGAMKTSVRWGIVGTGFIAHEFAQALRRAPGAELLAFGSRERERARELAGLYRAPRAYGDYAELCADRDVDVVYVATPAAQHREHALLALAHGKAVLCEKPFCTNAAEAREVVEEARRRRLFCMEAMWMRFIPLVQRVKSMVEHGDIGDIRLIEAGLAFPRSILAPDGGLAAIAPGALLDLGVYPISLVSYLLGPPDDVVGRASRVDDGDDEQVAGILEYPGRLAVVYASFRTEAANEAVIMGTRGRIHVHGPLYSPQRMSVSSVSAPTAPAARQAGWRGWIRRTPLVADVYRHVRTRLVPLVRGRSRRYVERFAGNGYQFEAMEVMRRLRAGEVESPLMRLDESVRIMEIMDSMRRQRRS